MRGGALSISGKERDWVGPSLIFGPLGARDRIRAEVGPVDGVTRPATEEEDSGAGRRRWRRRRVRYADGLVWMLGGRGAHSFCCCFLLF
jgi:hypothetical protein